MTVDWPHRFAAFVSSKTTAATEADLPGLTTIEISDEAGRLTTIGNTWTRTMFDGDFFESPPHIESLPAVSTVFVQSADGNTSLASMQTRCSPAP